MKLEELRAMVKKDLTVDPTELDIASLLVPQLHSKYLNLLMDEKLILRKLKLELSALKRDKWEYYSGRMSEERLAELGWEPFDLKILRQDVDIYLDADKDLIELKNKMSIQEEKVDYLNSVIKGITNRQFHIRDAITWRKFLNGSI
jgi:hypothetical protein